MLYRYNGFEQRTFKSGPTALIPTGAAYYVYDQAGKLLGEYDANQNPIYETVYLSMDVSSKVNSDLVASPVAVLKQTGTAAGSNIATSLYNVYSDHLATPRVVTRPIDEAIVWRWDSGEAFGATAPDQNPSNLGAFVFNQRLPGQVYDYETGLFQNHHREYNPRLGRYIQSDPIGLDGGINTYGYVSANPLRYTDPTGLIRHTTGQTKQCGNCTIRIDTVLDEKTGIVTRHLHWECKKGSGVGGEFGGTSHGDTLAGAPPNVKECARKFGFEPDPVPEPTCGDNCKKTIVAGFGAVCVALCVTNPACLAALGLGAGLGLATQ